ncbi:MAG: BMP family ABC transporter substrate-binding protein [Angelakisella sp.]
MKKLFAMLLATSMVVAMAACGAPTGAGDVSSSAPSSESASAAPAPAPESSSAAAPVGEANPRAQYQTGTSKAIAKDDLKIGFLYVGPVGDEGYSFAHDQGRKEMVKNLGLRDDQTMIVENVPEGAACAKTIRDLIDQGCNVIYATSFGHGEWAAEVAKEHPDVYFGHATGNDTLANMSTYMGRIYEARFLSGVAAGLKTKAGKIGYVAAMPIPEVVRGIDAFTLGVRSVNPTATVELLWTNSWYDPAAEKSAAQQLINNGADVIAQHCDTTGPQLAAEEGKVSCVGYNAPTLSAAPTAYLTAPLFHWGAFYTKDVQAIMDGKWTSQRFWGGINTGMVSLDALSANCTPETAAKVAELQKKIEAGELFVFSGPIKDNTGKEMVAAGAQMADGDMESMMWLVEGVNGNVPQA